MAFPTEHHRQIRSTNPLERLNKELKRRADVVGIEWVTGRRYFSQESMAKLRRASVPASEMALLAAD